MLNAIHEIARALLKTESAWNPKVVAGRAATAVLPKGTLHAVKKAYYARLLARLPEDFMERDSLLVKQLVSNGDHVVDIGASIGSYTKLLSNLVGPHGRVWSFEPLTETFDFLSNNVRRVGLKNVELVNSAVSDSDGKQNMVIPTYQWGADCSYDARIATAAVYDRHLPVQPRWKSELVTTTTLDSFFNRRESRISFIKCDANFHEFACLRGGLTTLRCFEPSLLIEVQPDPGDPNTTAFETFRLLRKEGYNAYCFDRTTLHPWRSGEMSQNYFFLTGNHLRRLGPNVLVQPDVH